MRLAVEAILVIAGALAVFWILWSRFQEFNSKMRSARARERREEEEWLDNHIKG